MKQSATIGFLVYALGSVLPALSQDDFRIRPYLQHPATDGITVRWFSESGDPGILVFSEEGSAMTDSVVSVPVQAPSLDYSAWESETFFENDPPQLPYRHSVRLEGLKTGTDHAYSVTQGQSVHEGRFRTAPGRDAPIRFIAYADCETEPESRGNHVGWNDPLTGAERTYLVDQSTGYRYNLEVIAEREPDLVFIGGDLVESGGEQRDWDEFWHNNACSSWSAADRIPLMPALGNHEYYAGPQLGRYAQPVSEWAVGKYLTYFETPPNQASNSLQEGRYYSLDYGPASFIVLDGCNNSPDSSLSDTNWMLRGEHDEGGGNAPDFGPGSVQYAWLSERLLEAEERSAFIFVILHHVPYSSGVHGRPPGTGALEDGLSGHPVRALVPLFMEYGVDAVFAGHSELWERSVVVGMRQDERGRWQEHAIHFYDLGTSGDGLRGPYEGAENPQSAFLVHSDAPEVWEDTVLLEGGKHYGHLEVNIRPLDDSTWTAVLDPVYILPVGDSSGAYSSYERKVYDDRVELFGMLARQDTAEAETGREPETQGFIPRVWPNPSGGLVHLRVGMNDPGPYLLEIFNAAGRLVFRTAVASVSPDRRVEYTWDGCGMQGTMVPGGVYHLRLTGADGGRCSTRLVRY